MIVIEAESIGVTANCLTKLPKMMITHSPSSIALFEKMVDGLGVPVEVATTEAHVPSFMVREHFFLKSLWKRSSVFFVLFLIILPLFSGKMGVLPVDSKGG